MQSAEFFIAFPSMGSTVSVIGFGSHSYRHSWRHIWGSYEVHHDILFSESLAIGASMVWICVLLSLVSWQFSEDVAVACVGAAHPIRRFNFGKNGLILEFRILMTYRSIFAHSSGPRMRDTVGDVRDTEHRYRRSVVLFRRTNLTTILV